MINLHLYEGDMVSTNYLNFINNLKLINNNQNVVIIQADGKTFIDLKNKKNITKIFEFNSYSNKELSEMIKKQLKYFNIDSFKSKKITQPLINLKDPFKIENELYKLNFLEFDSVYNDVVSSLGDFRFKNIFHYFYFKKIDKYFESINNLEKDELFLFLENFINLTNELIFYKISILTIKANNPKIFLLNHYSKEYDLISKDLDLQYFFKLQDNLLKIKRQNLFSLSENKTEFIKTKLVMLKVVL